jgi:hypothetical protein
MLSEWRNVTEMTRGEPIQIERLRVIRTGVQVEGEFALPLLARLTVEDQEFVAAFVRCHGSIKEMEAICGISYPTVKKRLDKIAGELGTGGVSTAASGVLAEHAASKASTADKGGKTGKGSKSSKRGASAGNSAEQSVGEMEASPDLAALFKKYGKGGSGKTVEKTPELKQYAVKTIKRMLKEGMINAEEAETALKKWS